MSGGSLLFHDTILCKIIVNKIIAHYYNSGRDGGKAVVREAQDTEEDTNLSNTEAAVANNDTDQISSTGSNNELVNSNGPDNSTQTDQVNVLLYMTCCIGYSV